MNVPLGITNIREDGFIAKNNYWLHVITYLTSLITILQMIKTAKKLLLFKEDLPFP